MVKGLTGCGLHGYTIVIGFKIKQFVLVSSVSCLFAVSACISFIVN